MGTLSSIHLQLLCKMSALLGVAILLPPLPSHSGGHDSKQGTDNISKALAQLPSLLNEVTPQDVRKLDRSTRNNLIDGFRDLLRAFGRTGLLPTDLDFGSNRPYKPRSAVGRHYTSKLVYSLSEASLLPGPKCLEWDAAYLQYTVPACTTPYVLRFPSRSSCPQKEWGEYFVSEAAHARMNAHLQKKYQPNERGFCANILDDTMNTIPTNFFDTV